jgi:NADH-quinone oxidoreductase subunit L
MTRLSLIPLLPLVGFLINGLLGSRFPRLLVSLVACALPAASFALTACLFLGLQASGTPISETYFSWAALPSLKVDVALYFDQISAIMCMVVTGVGTLIHIYSIGYMSHDESYSRYFAYLNLFLFFMLTLVLGKNMLILFAGWEGVGLASYLLIGYWFKDSEKTAAGMKAFIVNRVGDTGFILAAFLIWYFTKTLDFQLINAYFTATPPSLLIMNTIGILLLIGACGKSAQIPLHIWLPDAMAGPTPVSALIHAATMVTAGVYLLSRANGVFIHAPTAMNVVAWGGCLTAFLGATMGLTQYNLKKVLAYSTMSQIGYMFMACGLGAYQSAMFHLYTHAFFKACLFLGAGAVLHALHGEEDMRKMGGLAKKIPFTYWTFLLATLALCGVPPFAGFFSKDEILWSAWSAPNGSPLMWAIGVLTAGLTAFYMFRAISMTFFGASNVPEHASHGIHEPPPSMSIVLAILAVCSLVAGWIGLPGSLREMFGVSAPFYTFLGKAFPAHEVEAASQMETTLMIVSVGVAFAGILLSLLVYVKNREWATRVKQNAGCIYELVANGYYFDAFYYGIIVKTSDWVSEVVLGRNVEAAINDLALNKSAEGARSASAIFSWLQTGNVQAYVFYALLGLAMMLWMGVSNV